MPAATKKKRIDELLTKTTAALGRGAPFEAERMANKALHMAWQIKDYPRMVQVIEPLRDARQQRVAIAVEDAVVSVVREPITENMKVEPGVYLIQPPQVGADARRLRLAALHSEIPVFVVCREPLTQLGLVPIVAIGSGQTIRTKIDPPEDLEQPDVDWLIGAIDQIGEFAITSIDPAIEPAKHVEQLLQRIDIIPEHAELHDALAQACAEAEQAEEQATTEAEAKARAKESAGNAGAKSRSASSTKS